MPRFPGFGPRLSAVAAILIVASSCSSSSPATGKGGGSATGGAAGSVGSAGKGGIAGAGGAGAVGGSSSGGGIGGTTAGPGGASNGGAAGSASTGGAGGSAGNGGGKAGASGTGNAGGASAGGPNGGGGAVANCLGNNIDLPATKIAGTVTFNGVIADQPTTQGEGTLLLRRSVGGNVDSARLGSTASTGGIFSSLVFPGTYDLFYGQGTSGTTVAGNGLVKLQSGIVVGTSPVTLKVDIPTTKVAGTITVNGDALKTSPDVGEGSIRLVNTAGDSIFLAETAFTGTFSVQVVPGTYDVQYNSLTTGGPLPNNSAGTFETGVVVGTSPLTLNIDIPAPTVAATVTLTGETIAHPVAAQGTLTLINAAGDMAPLPTYASSAYSGRVVPGTYDVYWSGTGTSGPSNTMAKIKSGVVVGTTALSVAVDVPATVVSGNVAVEGATADVLSGTSSLFTLRGTDGGTVPLAVTTAGTYSARVVPGTYDLYFGSGSASAALATLPRNSAAKIQSGIVVGTAPLSLNINVPTVTVMGKVTINGAPITASGQNAFVLSLKNGTGDTATIANYPVGGAFSVSMIPGTYDLYYTRPGDVTTLVPNNGPAKLRSGIAIGAAPLTLDVDIRGTTVTGTITVNGLASAGAPGDLAFLALEDDAGGSGLLTNAAVATGTYSTFVVPGTYQLYYLVYRSGGSVLPTNSNTRLGCFVVP